MSLVDTLPPSMINHSFDPVELPSFKRKRSESATMPAAISNLAVEAPEKAVFDPNKHLNFEEPKKVWTMKEIGMELDGVSPNAVSEPFSLFTVEAVQQMRAEILSKPVLENCQYSSNIAKCQLRGMAPEYAPFVYDAWRSPEVLSIVSKIAGIDLVPAMDFEIGHINISINSEEDQKQAQKALAEHASRQADEGVAGCPWEDDEAPIVGWHRDSYPFVCVLMLSDCTNMIGGETALRTGTGDIKRVRGPGQGNAVVLQGRYIEHQALRTLGGSERITMVTSFRPKSALVRDDTVLTTVRPISDLSELYSQYSEYRLELLEERIRDQLRVIRDRKRAHRQFDTRATKTFLKEQHAFVASMLDQLVDDDLVMAGSIDDDAHLISKESKAENKKKAKYYVEGKK